MLVCLCVLVFSFFLRVLGMPGLDPTSKCLCLCANFLHARIACEKSASIPPSKVISEGRNTVCLMAILNIESNSSLCSFTE
jgi:hypothetical protein